MEKLTRIMRFPGGAIWTIRSSDPRKLFKQYLSRLRKGNHPNKELQDIYNTQGEPILQDPPNQ